MSNNNTRGVKSYLAPKMLQAFYPSIKHVFVSNTKVMRFEQISEEEWDFLEIIPNPVSGLYDKYGYDVELPIKYGVSSHLKNVAVVSNYDAKYQHRDFLSDNRFNYSTNLEFATQGGFYLAKSKYPVGFDPDNLYQDGVFLICGVYNTEPYFTAGCLIVNATDATLIDQFNLFTNYDSVFPTGNQNDAIRFNEDGNEVVFKGYSGSGTPTYNDYNYSLDIVNKIASLIGTRTKTKDSYILTNTDNSFISYVAAHYLDPVVSKIKFEANVSGTEINWVDTESYPNGIVSGYSASISASVKDNAGIDLVTPFSGSVAAPFHISIAVPVDPEDPSQGYAYAHSMDMIHFNNVTDLSFSHVLGDKVYSFFFLELVRWDEAHFTANLAASQAVMETFVSGFIKSNKFVYGTKKQNVLIMNKVVVTDYETGKLLYEGLPDGVDDLSQARLFPAYGTKLKQVEE